MVNIILILMLLAGIGIMAYPSFSNWYNSLHQSRAIADYNEAVSSNDDARNEEMWKEALAYNEALAKTGVNFQLSMYNAENTDGSAGDEGNNAAENGAAQSGTEDGSTQPGTEDGSTQSGTEDGTLQSETENGSAQTKNGNESGTEDGTDALAAARRKYEETLDVSGTGIMGYINIDKVNIHLPIYHDSSEGVLQVAVGHIAGTSLPVGGKSSHSVLTGHTGLPSAKLFTDIDQLEEGDTFQLVVLDHTLTYEVDDIRVVLPTEVDSLQIEKGKDLCTLVTCTPYGINTHRLLVTGHRIATPAVATTQTPPSQTWQAEKRNVTILQILPFAAAGAVAVLVILLIVHAVRKRKHQPSASAVSERDVDQVDQSEGTAKRHVNQPGVKSDGCAGRPQGKLDYEDQIDPAEEERLSFIKLPYPDLKTPEELEDTIPIVHLDDADLNEPTEPQQENNSNGKRKQK